MAHSSSIKLWSFYTDGLRRVEVCKIEMSHLYWEWGEGDNVNEWCNLPYSAQWSESKLMDADIECWEVTMDSFSIRAMQFQEEIIKFIGWKSA